jgi:hypothetical protein
MPDNASLGMLEDLCLETLQGTPIEDCLQHYVACFSSTQLPEEQKHFKPSKAHVQAYLASRAPIVPSLGLGALHNYWDLDHSCFSEIKRFLTALFP